MISRKRQTEIKEYVRVAARGLSHECIKSEPLAVDWHDYKAQAKFHKTRKDRLAFALSLARTCAEEYCVDLPTLTVGFGATAGEAGFAFCENNKWHIDIEEAFLWSDLAISAIMAHEMAHVVLGLLNIRLAPTLRNEELTDTTAILAGFGNTMKEAYSWRENFGIQFRIGYLTADEIVYASKLRRLIRGGLPIRRLCPIDPHFSDYIKCYICSTKLRIPKLDTAIDILCPNCTMRQIVTIRGSRSKRKAEFFSRHFWHPILSVIDQMRGFE